jgi:CheY-like chemotaxis protein
MMALAMESHPSVLVVDDSATDQQLMHRLLERLGCDCTVVEDGKGAIEAAASGDYDFVFMDLELPNVDGFEATRRIHDRMGPDSPFIVALTAHDTDADRARCADAGIDYFLAKPIRLPVLRGLLRDN